MRNLWAYLYTQYFSCQKETSNVEEKSFFDDKRIVETTKRKKIPDYTVKWHDLRTIHEEYLY